MKQLERDGMDVDDATSFIKEKWRMLENSEKLLFKDFIQKNWRAKNIDYLNDPGVYVVYEGDIAVYVGSAGKGKHFIRYRIGDLFGYRPRAKKPFYHTLTMKLLKERNGSEDLSNVSRLVDDARGHLMKTCSFKVIRTDNVRQARMLEYVF